MENNDELKEINIKNTTCYYIHGVIEIEYFDFDNILLYEKTYENISFYEISYKTLTGAKLLHIKFDKVDGLTRVYDGAMYLILFGAQKYDAIYDRVRLDKLFAKKVVLSMLFLIIMQELQLFCL